MPKKGANRSAAISTYMSQALKPPIPIDRYNYATATKREGQEPLYSRTPASKT
jgi:hypothetical protein